MRSDKEPPQNKHALERCDVHLYSVHANLFCMPVNAWLHASSLALCRSQGSSRPWFGLTLNGPKQLKIFVDFIR